MSGPMSILHIPFDRVFNSDHGQLGNYFSLLSFPWARLWGQSPAFLNLRQRYIKQPIRSDLRVLNQLNQVSRLSVDTKISFFIKSTRLLSVVIEIIIFLFIFITFRAPRNRNLFILGNY